MFGMGFTEILIIAIIAILFLGPDKLPGAMIDIAKFFRSAKNAIGNVKDTLEEEMNVSDIKREALAYKAQIEDMTSKLDVKAEATAQLTSLKDSVLSEDEESDTPLNPAPKEAQEVTFKKRVKKDSYAEVEDV